MYSIKECLRGYTTEALGDICSRWRLEAINRLTRIRALERILTDPLHLRDTIRNLSDEALRLAHLLVQCKTTTVADAYSVHGLYTENNALPVLQELMMSGLVLVCPQTEQGAFSFSHLEHEPALAQHTPCIFIPDIVAQILPAAPVMSFSIPCADTEVTPDPPISPETATSVLLELLRVIELHPPRITASNTFHRSDITKAREHAHDNGVSAENFEISLMVAQAMGCLEARDGLLQTTAFAEEWVRSPLEDRMKTMLLAFLHSENLSDLKMFFPAEMEMLENYLPEKSMRRNYHRILIFHLFKGLPHDAWLSLHSIIGELRRIDRNVLFLNESWRASSMGTQGQESGWKERAWQTHEQRYYMWLMRSVFVDFGFLETAEQGKWVQLTPIGRYVVGDTYIPAQLESNNDNTLVVQSNFDIVVYGDNFPPEMRRKLDAFCERVRNDVASTYRITEESIYRGVSTGLLLEDFIVSLQQHARNGVPGNVNDQLTSWARKLDTICIRTGCHLVECPDSRAAESLLIENKGARRMGDHFILVENESPDFPVKIVYDAPAISIAEQESGLVLRAPWDKTSLLFRRRAEELGEVSLNPQGDCIVRLKKPHAAKSLDAEIMLARVEELTREPLHSQFRAAIRAWCGSGATAETKTATCIRFNDTEAFQAAYELGMEADCLEGRLGDRTLVVCKGRLVEFKRILSRYGLSVAPSHTSWDDGPITCQEKETPVETTKHSKNGNDQAAQPRRESNENAESERLPSYSLPILREVLEDAIVHRHPVLLAYRSSLSSHVSMRQVNPVSLDLSGRHPILNAYCREQGSRTFKLAQIRGIRVVENETF